MSVILRKIKVSPVLAFVLFPFSSYKDKTTISNFIFRHVSCSIYKLPELTHCYLILSYIKIIHTDLMHRLIITYLMHWSFLALSIFTLSISKGITHLITPALDKNHLFPSYGLRRNGVENNYH